MTYLPWAGSLESDITSTSPDHPDRPVNPESHADPLSRPGPGTSPEPSSPPRPASLGERSQAESYADSGVSPEAAALGQMISNRLFSASFDLHFVMMTRNDGPGVRRLEHAIAEIDDAIKDLRHLILAITQRLA
ncbi:MAG TPA: hypothetical protein VF060_18115 [Trebonia sp.]